MKKNLLRMAGLLAIPALFAGFGSGTLAQTGGAPCYKLVMTPV